jgi:hypothetical protein
MTMTLKADLRRLILQSESDLLAHARLRDLSADADDIAAADRQSQETHNPYVNPTGPPARGRPTRATSRR